MLFELLFVAQTGKIFNQVYEEIRLLGCFELAYFYDIAFNCSDTFFVRKCHTEANEEDGCKYAEFFAKALALFEIVELFP